MASSFPTVQCEFFSEDFCPSELEDANLCYVCDRGARISRFRGPVEMAFVRSFLEPAVCKTLITGCSGCRFRRISNTS